MKKNFKMRFRSPEEFGQTVSLALCHADIYNEMMKVDLLVMDYTGHLNLNLDVTYQRACKQLRECKTVEGMQKVRDKFYERLREQLKRIDKTNLVDYAITAQALGIDEGISIPF